MQLAKILPQHAASLKVPRHVHRTLGETRTGTKHDTADQHNLQSVAMVGGKPLQERGRFAYVFFDILQIHTKTVANMIK